MTTVQLRKNTVCTICGKTAGMFTCSGCSKSFCLQHTNQHRQVLDEQINAIIIHHNRFKQDVNDPKASDRYYPTIVKEIDQWEEQSIDRIHQTANEIRHQLVDITREHLDNIKGNLIPLTQQLTKAQDDEDFVENDLQQWTHTLENLQRTLVKQRNILLHHENNNSLQFISRISLMEITNHETRPLKYKTNDYRPDDDYHVNSSIQGDYSSAEHRLRFQLGQYLPTSRVLIGIISKNTQRYIDPYQNPTFYGWGQHNLVYLHGVVYPNCYNHRNDIEKDGIFQLVLDCDQRIIRLINERTGQKFEINVDLTRCPFPWQPHIRLINN